jgi:hypothetical protein
MDEELVPYLIGAITALTGACSLLWKTWRSDRKEHATVIAADRKEHEEQLAACSSARAGAADAYAAKVEALFREKEATVERLQTELKETMREVLTAMREVAEMTDKIDRESRGR